MSTYEELVNRTQMNYSRYYQLYAMGKTPYELSGPCQLSYEEQIQQMYQKIEEAECIVVGAASGLSAAGGGDFYYEDNDSYRKYFKKFADHYHFKGAFAGMMHPFSTREEYWGYLATFLHTTQTAPIRKPYLDLDALINEKDYFVLTTNQDTQFIKIYDESKVSQIQGDHRFFQCSRQCCDETWDAVIPVQKMIDSMGESRCIESSLIPHCPHCGAEMFPWVRGYGNFMQGTKYHEQYQKVSDYIDKNKDKKILFLELGVGRMTPMFIQEPFWNLTYALRDAYYISINDRYDFMPKQLEKKGMVIISNIATVLEDVKKFKEKCKGSNL